MLAQLFGFILFACQIILNGSSVIPVNGNSTESELLTRSRLASTFPLGYVIFPDDHAAYRIHEERATWYEARDRCKSEGARLAIPDTANKTDHITSLKIDWEFYWVHVGIYRSNSTGNWVRVDSGLNATSIPWAVENPADMGNCTGISITEDGVIDYPCNYSARYYVCEILL